MPTPKKDLSGLTLLGRAAKPSKKLEAFPNHDPERDYIVTLTTDEFTCICPVTGSPTLPKSRSAISPIKKWSSRNRSNFYFWSYRNEGVFHEHVTNTILDDLVKVLSPRWCEVVADFSMREGLRSV